MCDNGNVKENKRSKSYLKNYKRRKSIEQEKQEKIPKIEGESEKVGKLENNYYKIEKNEQLNTLLVSNISKMKKYLVNKEIKLQRIDEKKIASETNQNSAKEYNYEKNFETFSKNLVKKKLWIWRWML